MAGLSPSPADDPWAPVDDPWAQAAPGPGDDPWAPVEDPWAAQETAPTAPVAPEQPQTMLDMVGNAMRQTGKAFQAVGKATGISDMRWGDIGPEIVNQTLTRLKLGGQAIKQAGIDTLSDATDVAVGTLSKMNPDEKALYQWVKDQANRQIIKPALDKVQGQTAGIVDRSAQFSQQFMPDQNFAERSVVGGASSVAGVAPLLGVAALTRRPNVVLAPMSGLTGAETYATERAQGETQGDSAVNAALQGMIEYWTERLPTMALLDVKSSAGRAVLDFIWKDLVGEQFATAGQNAVDQLVGEIQQPMTVKDFLQAQADTLGATLVAGPLQAAGPYALARGRQLAEERKKEARAKLPIKVPPPPKVDPAPDSGGTPDPWAPVGGGQPALEGELQPRLEQTPQDPISRELNERARRNRPALEDQRGGAGVSPAPVLPDAESLGKASQEAPPAPTPDTDPVQRYLTGEATLDDALDVLRLGVDQPEGGPSSEPPAAGPQDVPRETAQTPKPEPQAVPTEKPQVKPQESAGTGYSLPQGKVNDDWIGSLTADFTPNPRQQSVMAAVEAGLDAGVFYAKDMLEFVAERLSVPAETRKIGADRVEGGDFGYDVFKARKAVEARRAMTAGQQTASALRLRPGDKLGTIIPNDGKQVRAATVESVNEKTGVVTLIGSRGRSQVRVTLQGDSLKRAINRASEAGARADNFEQLTAARTQPEPTEETREAAPIEDTAEPVTIPAEAQTEHETRVNKAGNEAVQEIADVGENLWYNRRNFTGGAIGWSDIKDLNATLKVKEAVKAKVWPRPNYEGLVADGMNPTIASMVKGIYDTLPTKPQGYGTPDDAKIERYMDVMGRVRDAVFDWAKDRDATLEFAEQAAAAAKKHMEMGPFAFASLSPEVRDAILARVWPGEIEKARPDRWREPAVRAEVLVIGNKAFKGLQLSFSDVTAAVQRVKDGWPAKQEAWEKRFEIKEQAGTDGGQPTFYVVKKGRRRPLAEGLQTREAAVEAARKLAKSSRESGGADLRGMNLAAAQREGPVRRQNDENISADQLMKVFGFRGVNFGRTSWISHAERQEFVNAAYDALMDMAEIMGVPPKALSLNGLLGIAFGAQGRGGKRAAHFVPGHNEINLTKTAGAGTLAHEWGHALDHYFAVRAGEQYAKRDEPYMSSVVAGDFRSPGVRPVIAMAFKNIREAMRRRAMTPEEQAKFDADAKAAAVHRLNKWLDYIRSRMEERAKYRASHGKTKADREALETIDSILENFDDLAKKLRAGDTGNGMAMAGKKMYFDHVAQIRVLYQSAAGRLLENDATEGLENAARFVRHTVGKIAAAEGHEPQMRDTDYLRQSRAKDSKNKQYWSQDTEMFARAFELWVSSQLKARGQVNTFLSDADLRQVMIDQTGGPEYPYPRGIEQEKIEGAFTSLIKQLETKPSSKGIELSANPFGAILDAVNDLFDSVAARTTGKVYDLLAEKLAFMTPLKDLPQQSLYRQKRGLTGGKLEVIDELSRKVYDTFKDLNAADSMAVYTYLTTKGAPLPAVDRKVAQTAQAVKQSFDVLGRQMVRLGLISQEAFDKYQGSYLPRLYLRHVLEMGGFGTGMRTSDLGQTKRRKEIDPAVRELILGEIKDPAFLAAFGMTRTARDVSILELLNDIATVTDWVPSGQLINFNGRAYSPVAALQEVAILRRNADHTEDTAAQATMRQMAKSLEALAEQALGNSPADRSKYKQVPDSPRYGLLRGLWVRSEIYDDLIGGIGFVPAEASDLQRFFSASGMGGQVTRWFKWGKVAAYPPAQFRNVMGNVLLVYLSGVPMHRLVPLTGKVFSDWRKGGPISQAMQRYGVFRSTFTAQEMQRVEREWLDFRKRLAAGQGGARASAWAIADVMATVANGFSDAYQFAEAMFKGVKIAHELEKGTPLAEAVQEAQTWLFDYSEVPAWLRYSRNAPIGTPFLTWTYKIAPRLAEVALKHPQRFIPFIVLPHVLAAFMQAAFDLDDDDIEKLQETLPNWLREKGGAMFLPWLDSNGRWQAVDVGYILPWYNFELVGKELMRGNPGEALAQISIAQGPGRTIIDAMSNHDSFRDQPIYRPEDTPATRYGKLVAHLWNGIAPGMVTSSSFIFRSLEPTGLVVPDSVREPITAGQAAVRPFGLNVYPINPQEQRQRNLGQYRAQLAEIDRRWRSKVRRAPEEKREGFRQDWLEERARFIREMQEYAARSEPTPAIVNPKRRSERPEA